MNIFRKKHILKVMVLLLVLAPFSGYGENSVDSLKLPPVKTYELHNGVRIFYIKDDLPVLTIAAAIGYGQLYETKENAGIANLIQRTLSICGSKKYPNIVLNKTIDSMGGKLSISSSWEQTLITIKVLARFKDTALDILTDLIKNPNFNEKDFMTARNLMVESINRKFDEPEVIAFEKARSIIFNGDGYGSVPAIEQVNKYILQNVQETWDKYFVARNIMVGISTSVGFDEIKQDATAKFAVWPKGKSYSYASNSDALVKEIAEKKKNIYFYKKNIPQATIVVGTIAPDIKYQGDAALRLMNYILGGGAFNSRLMREIRVKRGMAYSVQSIVRGRRETGVFLAYAQTGNKTVAEVFSLLKSNINKMMTDKISVEELEWAKKSVINSYIFMFDTPTNLLSNYLNIAYNKLSKDYYTTYLDKISDVTTQNILDESNKLFKNGIITVIVGDESLMQEMQKFGTIIKLN